jgi:hypothetical protein
MLTRKTLALVVAGCAALAVAGAASAQNKIQTGTLTCTGKGGVGLVLGSQKTLSCRYKPNGNRPAESYRATITKIGLDVGVTGDTTMVWAVLASTSSLAPGSLAGNYAGAAADASVAVGGGAQLLVGGSNNAISLQPLSVQGQTGLNLAVGVASMSLKKAR